MTSNMKVNDPMATGCPIARALHYVGEGWCLLILRDALQGISRFDEFEKSLAISTSMLARRLKQMVTGGLLEKRSYQTRPTRYEYHLTDKGKALYPVLMMLFDWGEKYASPDGSQQVVLVHRVTGHVLEPVVIDQVTGEPLTFDNLWVASGPDVSPPMSARIRRIHTHLQQTYPLSGDVD